MRISGMNRRHLGLHIFALVFAAVVIVYGICAYAFITHFWSAWLVPIVVGVFTLGNSARYWRKWQQRD